MIYSFKCKAKQTVYVEKIMKIRAETEEEARELCQNLMNAGLDKGIWTQDSFRGEGNVEGKHISECTKVEEE